MIANAAMWCLVCLFIVNVLFSGVAQMALSSGDQRPLLIVDGLMLLLMLSSAIGGTIALIGVAKYGRKRLLWKGLVAVLVPVLLAAAAIPAFLKIKRLSEERARQHQQAPAEKP